MKKTIWKYPLKITDQPQKVELPVNAEVLVVKIQNQIPYIWCLVDVSEKAKDLRTFVLYGTGDEIFVDNFEKFSYIGTIQYTDFREVRHLFEVK